MALSPSLAKMYSNLPLPLLSWSHVLFENSTTRASFERALIGVPGTNLRLKRYDLS